MDKVPVSELLTDLSRFFTNRGFKLYLVGGAVRDMFLGKEAKDWDVATNATPEQVSGLFKRCIPTGIEHGTVTIPFRNHMIECTTFRTEQGFTDGRHPDTVSFTATIEEDLSRRDFTMNAIAVSLPDGLIIDPLNGQADIRSGIIRSVGIATQRFEEDGLRPLRAVRFAAQLDFNIDGETLQAITQKLSVTALVAQERIRDELQKIILSAKPSKGLLLMEKTGLLNLIIPELEVCRGIEQKGSHHFDVLDHLFYTCDAAEPNNLELRLAALFHDIGKPQVQGIDKNGTCTFYNHEIESAKITEEILIRLRFPTKVIKTVCHLISQHMFHYESLWTDAAIRRFIARVGQDSLELLFALRQADLRGMSNNPIKIELLSEFRSRISDVIEKNDVFKLKDLDINGSDLIFGGIKAGPIIGYVLNELLEIVLDEPTLNKKPILMDIAYKIYLKKQNRFSEKT